MMKLKAPQDVTAVSIDGKSYKIEKDGTVNVPDELAINLYQQGFTVTVDQDPVTAIKAAAKTAPATKAA